MFKKGIKRPSKVSKSTQYSVFTYPCPDEKGMFISHCLELDLIGYGNSVEESMSELLECIDTQIKICEEEGIELLFPAPDWVWSKYKE